MSMKIKERCLGNYWRSVVIRKEYALSLIQTSCSRLFCFHYTPIKFKIDEGSLFSTSAQSISKYRCTGRYLAINYLTSLNYLAYTKNSIIFPIERCIMYPGGENVLAQSIIKQTSVNRQKQLPKFVVIQTTQSSRAMR